MTDLRIVPPKPFDTDVAIVGGGLAGLTAACRLAASGQGVTLFEARSRLGGRMLTTGVMPVAERPWVDLGPAWFWPHHQHMGRELQRSGESHQRTEHCGGRFLRKKQVQPLLLEYGLPHRR